MAELGYFGDLALGMLSAAESSRENARLTVDLFTRLRERRQDISPADYINALVAENDALRADNAGLRANIDVLQDYIAKYKAWARAEIARLENR